MWAAEPFPPPEPLREGRPPPCSPFDVCEVRARPRPKSPTHLAPRSSPPVGKVGQETGVTTREESPGGSAALRAFFAELSRIRHGTSIALARERWNHSRNRVRQ